MTDTDNIICDGIQSDDQDNNNNSDDQDEQREIIYKPWETSKREIETVTCDKCNIFNRHYLRYSHNCEKNPLHYREIKRHSKQNKQSNKPNEAQPIEDINITTPNIIVKAKPNCTPQNIKRLPIKNITALIKNIAWPVYTNF